MATILETRLARLIAQRDELDDVLTAMAGGVEEVQKGSVRYRYSQRTTLEGRLAQIESKISTLQALMLSGGRTLLRKGAS